jgi:signal peptide peptidase SppA
MKSYPRLFQKLFASPLMLHAPVRSSFETQLLARMFGDSGAIAVPLAAPVTSEEPQDPTEWRTRRIYQRYNNVAVITIDGVIDKRISEFEMECYGGVDLADVDSALSQAASDTRVDTIVLDINSPGGSVIGVSDTATRIASLRQTKEVHAFINCLACSAGYYLASQADVIAASPSAIVGSIGVYCAILDASEYYAKLGAKMQFIKAGEFKTMGTEWRPLTAAESALLQEGVNTSYNAFKAACTDLRPIADSTMQGQWFDGSQAHDLHLVDQLTGATLDEYVSALLLG